MKPNLFRYVHRIIFLLVGCPLLFLSSVTSVHGGGGITISDVAPVGRVAAFTRPIVWVGAGAPTSDDTSALAAAFLVWFNQGEDAGVQALEAFVESYTNSAWLPSLESQLGRYYRERGRYTLALQHWAASWDATREASDDPAKEVADFTLAFYTRLLASLGRIETLDDIFAEMRGRVLDQGPLSQIYMGTMEGWTQMHRSPGHSYRCGAYALNEVAKALRGTNYDRSVFNAPSQATGFSVADLVQMQNRINLGLVAAVRLSGNQLVVPSVIHWQQAHYAAVLDQRGDLFLVIDPTFGHPQWLRAEVINSEASGVFLLPATLLPPTNWRLLSSSETRSIFGRGNPGMFRDGPNSPCPDSGCCPPGHSGSDGSDGGDGNNEGSQSAQAQGVGSGGDGHKAITSACQYCKGHREIGDRPAKFGFEAAAPGMPVWRVAEPFINLWLEDEPLGYQPALGDWISFHLAFKQRDEDSSLDPAVYSVGSSWNVPIISYVYSSLDYRYGPVSATVYFPGGGSDSFSFNNGVATNYYNNNTLQAFTNANNNVTSYVLTRPDGSSFTYSFFRTDTGGSWSYVYLTQMTDRRGYTATFSYAAYDPNTMVVRLNSISDPDGHNVTFSYNAGVSGNTNLISQVTDPFSRSATLQYNSSALLTNITDVVSLSSGITYDANGWPSSLTTPYGTTYFTLTSSTNDYIDINGGIDRSVLISEPNGGHQLYLYRGYSPQMPGFYPASEVPTNTPLGTFNNSAVSYNNSFYWNRQQYAALSTTIMDSFSDSDYLKARVRNWLYHNGFDSWPDQTLNIEQAPSPDGVTPGQKTWYDYEGKPIDDYSTRGTQIMPAVVAQVLPDGSTRYVWLSRNSWGLPTRTVETYTLSNGSIGTRTNNLAYYDNGLDLKYELGPNGELLHGFSYNGYHQVLTYTNAMAEVTSYTYAPTTRLLTYVSYPSGLTTTNSYNSNNRLSQRVDQPINRTNSFTYYTTGLVYSHTDERGLTVTNYWDNLQRLVGRQFSDSTTLSNIYTYLDVTATKDRLSQWAYSGYNAIRQKIAETNVNNVITRYGYCDCGALLYLTNAFGTTLAEVTSFAYDLQGNRTFIFFPYGTAITNWYDSLRRPIATADDIGTRWFGYNNQSLLTSITNAAGVEQRILFDIEDRVYSSTDANGVTVTNTYDNLGRLRTRTYPDTGAEKFGYSALGLVKYTNQLNLVTSYGYDAALRKTSETNANNEVIKYTYNAASDLKTLTDGKNQVTTWNYDLYGRVTNKLDQASVEILRYSYDANSRLTNRWSAAKGNTAYLYDNVGNLTKVDYPSGTTDITLQYDANNRLTNMVDAAGTTKYTYKPGGLLWTEDGPWANDTMTNTFNNARLRSGLVLQQPTGTWTNGFTYDAAHRLSTVSSPAGTFSYTYRDAQPSTLIKKLSLPNTSYITNTYDSVARLTGTYLDNSSNTILDKSEYLYNVGNQRIRLTRTDGSYYTNTYDNIGQLKWADSTVNTEDRGYLYDSAWNLNTRTNNGATTAFNVDVKNQLSSVGGSGCTYDSNGNLIVSQPNAVTCSYDAENQLISAETASWWRTEWVYDGRSRLRIRREYGWMSGYILTNEVHYIYDGMRVIQERNSSNTPTVSYTRGSDLSGSLEGAGGIGGLLARSHGYSSGNWTTHNHYHADGNGNITYMVDASQAVAASYRYDPFGNTISSSGTLASANLYRFSSKENQGNSGLYYYGYRFYDPNLQRWPNRDPLGVSIRKRFLRPRGTLWEYKQIFTAT